MTDRMIQQDTRTEHDLLGDLEVPTAAYYGAHTARAVRNFPISGVTISSYPSFIAALAIVKQAAATANRELGLLPESEAAAIIAACQEIRGGALHDQFVVDVIQGGAGTSTNMNVNEVIANRGLEHLGFPRGAYTELHPLDHVNLGQSTNDVYPTAVKLALDRYVTLLGGAVGSLREAFAAKAVEFADIVKIGRTQLQDAVPMTLGQEFATYAVTLAEDEARLEEARLLLHELNLGGTAIGTALNAHPEYQSRVLEELRALTGIPTLTGAIPEVINQIAFEVIGNDVTVTLAAEGGQLQLNAFEPIIAKSLFASLEHLIAGCNTLATRCVSGITANVEHLRGNVQASIGLVTALNPAIGYASATAIAQEALAGGRSVAELVLEHALLTREQIGTLLSPEHLTGRRQPHRATSSYS